MPEATGPYAASLGMSLQGLPKAWNILMPGSPPRVGVSMPEIVINATI